MRERGAFFLFSFPVLFFFFFTEARGVGDRGASLGGLDHEDRIRFFSFVPHRPYRPRSVYD
jgi:hypothetical protein